jgi:hypothetical protein
MVGRKCTQENSKLGDSERKTRKAQREEVLSAASGKIPGFEQAQIFSRRPDKCTPPRFFRRRNK